MEISLKLIWKKVIFICRIFFRYTANWKTLCGTLCNYSGFDLFFFLKKNFWIRLASSVGIRERDSKAQIHVDVFLWEAVASDGQSTWIDMLYKYCTSAPQSEALYEF
ncbi:hypothetical protein MANES_06G127050v8 [Manihot esculenta]|uniref:Uncharacterized protein n=1 Tax=Manihot esculenta TaxID=3983 RepID=A0ACB7HKR7_MANES|nr:hypothetical protein MANES_06G127050v8 [Manihot esculenta]